MKLFRVFDNGKIIRIEEENGARITVEIAGDQGRVLSVWVPEEERREGMGSVLFSVVEREAYLIDAKYMKVIFSDELKELRAFLEDRGYEIEEKEKVFSLEISGLRESSAIKHMIRRSYPKARSVSLKKMRKKEIVGVLQFLDKMSIAVHGGDLGYFSKDLSLAVYDEDNEVRVVILTTPTGDEISVDLLWEDVDKSAMYVEAALSEFSSALFSLMENEEFKKISAVVGNEHTLKLLEKLSTGDAVYEEKRRLLYAKKELSYNPDEYEIEDEIFDEAKGLWRYEAEFVPGQYNLCFRVND